MLRCGVGPAPPHTLSRHPLCRSPRACSDWCLQLDNALDKLPQSPGAGVYLGLCPDSNKPVNGSTGFWDLESAATAANGDVTGKLASLYVNAQNPSLRRGE